MWGFGWLSFSGLFSKVFFDYNGPLAYRYPRLSVPDRPQQNSPLLKLPAELRIVIYDMALQDLFDDIVNEYETTTMVINELLGYKPRPLPLFVGALALLHTGYKLRDEGLSAMRRIAENRYRTLQHAEDAARAKMQVKNFSETEFREILVKSNTARGGSRLSDHIDNLDWGHRSPRLYTPWSNLRHAQKLSVAKKCYMESSREEQAQLDDEVFGSGTYGSEVSLWLHDEGPADYEDKWETLVETLDRRVARRERRDYFHKQIGLL